MHNKTRDRRIRKALHTCLPDEGTPELELWQLNRDTSLFLRLPPEIRNRIYELLLSVGQINVHFTPWQISKTYSIQGGFGCEILGRDHNPHALAKRTASDKPARGLTLLAGVCRQLYHETALLPYQLNIWSFESGYVMGRFIQKEKRLSRHQRQAIHTLYVPYELKPHLEKIFGGLKVQILGDGTKLVKTPLTESGSTLRGAYKWTQASSGD